MKWLLYAAGGILLWSLLKKAKSKVQNNEVLASVFPSLIQPVSQISDNPLQLITGGIKPSAINITAPIGKPNPNFHEGISKLTYTKYDVEPSLMENLWETA